MDPNELQGFPDGPNSAGVAPDPQSYDNSADMVDSTGIDPSQLADDQTDALFAAHSGSPDTSALLGDQHIHESTTLGGHTINASNYMDGQQLLEHNPLTHNVAYGHAPHPEITFGASGHGHHDPDSGITFGASGHGHHDPSSQITFNGFTDG